MAAHDYSIHMKFGLNSTHFTLKHPRNQIENPGRAFAEDALNLISLTIGRSVGPDTMQSVRYFRCVDKHMSTMKLIRTYHDLKKDNYVEVVIWPEQIPQKSNHHFVTLQRKRPLNCHCCEGLIWSVSRGYYKCTDCKAHIHRKCAPKFLKPCVPNTFFTDSDASTQRDSDSAGDTDGTRGGVVRSYHKKSRTYNQKLVKDFSSSAQESDDDLSVASFYNHDLRRITCLEKGIKNLRFNNNKWTGVYNTINERRHTRYKFTLDVQCNEIELEIKNDMILTIHINEGKDTFILKVDGKERLEGMMTEHELDAIVRGIMDRLKNIKFDEAENHHLKITRFGKQSQDFSDLFDINVDHLLGSGRFGKVFSGKHKKTGRPVAIKKIQCQNDESNKQDIVDNEVKFLMSLDHPGILRCEGVFQQNDCFIFVTEQLDIDMLEYIVNSKDPSGRLSEAQTKLLCFQILCALIFLHSRNIAHCDLKPDNVLLKFHGPLIQTKLADFGHARVISENSFRHSLVGTLAYLPPEVHNKNLRISRGYNRSLDIWSFGAIMYVSLCGCFPFLEDVDLLDQIENGSIVFVGSAWDDVSTTAQNLISGNLMVPSAGRRMTSQGVIHHQWFTGDASLIKMLTELEQMLGRVWLTTFLQPPPGESSSDELS